MRTLRCAPVVVGLCVVAFAAACGPEVASSGVSGSSASKSGASKSPKKSSDSANGANTAGPPQLEGFESLHPQGDERTYYAGFDGTNDYVAPLAFYADAPPTVTIADPSVAALQGQPMTITRAMVPDLPPEIDGRMQIIFVQSKSAGQTTITATSGKVTAKATLKVTQYSPNDVVAGEQRYEKGAPACMSCHESLGVHNPGMLVDLADETLLGIATEGKSLQKINTETGKVETIQPNNGNHKWNVTAAERTGLMAYLRSRPLTWQMQMP